MCLPCACACSLQQPPPATWERHDSGSSQLLRICVELYWLCTGCVALTGTTNRAGSQVWTCTLSPSTLTTPWQVSWVAGVSMQTCWMQSACVHAVSDRRSRAPDQDHACCLASNGETPTLPVAACLSSSLPLCCFCLQTGSRSRPWQPLYLSCRTYACCCCATTA